MLFTSTRPFVASAVIGAVPPIRLSQRLLTSVLANEQAPSPVSASPVADPEYYRHIDERPAQWPNRLSWAVKRNCWQKLNRQTIALKTLCLGKIEENKNVSTWKIQRSTAVL